MASDQIIIRGLKLSCHIGVPDEERALAQELLLDLVLVPKALPEGHGQSQVFDALEDDLEKTIDYDELTRSVVERARTSNFKLIETLSSDIAQFLLEKYPLKRVALTLRKFILPNTEFVAVKIERETK